VRALPASRTWLGEQNHHTIRAGSNHHTILVKECNCRCLLHCFEERNCRCLLRWWIHTIKLSLESSWYHMHVEVSRTLHALKVGKMCHTSVFNLVNMCIGEFGECCNYVEF